MNYPDLRATTRAPAQPTGRRRPSWRSLFALLSVAAGVGRPVQGDPCVLHEIGEVVPDDLSTVSTFGSALAFDGSRLVVGDTGDPYGKFIGAAYVFRLDENATPWDLTDDRWIQEDKLTPSDGSFGRHFGNAVAISGDWIVVASYQDDDAGLLSGSAYMFRRDDAGTADDPADDHWIEHQKLLASDAGPYGYFAQSVSIAGDWLVVGAPNCGGVHPWCVEGSAYVFAHDDNRTPGDLSDDSWFERAKLGPWTPSTQNVFGAAVVLQGRRLAVGCPLNDDRADNAGAVFIFFRDENGTPADPSDDEWLPEAMLTAADGAASDVFGEGLALSGDLLVAGAPGADEAGRDVGSAYIFRLADGGTPLDTYDDQWLLQDKLLPTDGIEFGHFGRSVYADETEAIIGAPGVSISSAPEAAYLFRRDDHATPSDPMDDSWAETAGLRISTDAVNDGFGEAVLIHSERVLVGAPFLGAPEPDTPGAVYLFPGSRDCVTLLELSVFQNCMGLDAVGPCETFDFEPNGVLDLVDYRQLILTWTGP